MEEYNKLFEGTGTASTFTISQPELSKWTCYMFGTKPWDPVKSFVYIPLRGYEPNWFVRIMMKICFDCTWVKDGNQ